MSDAPRVVTLGETMALVRSADVGSLRDVSAMTLGIGGAESNVAVALRRLGVDAAWLGRVGDDPLGERIVRQLRGEGVHLTVVVDGDAPTGLMLKERPHAMATAVHYYRAGSAGSRLTSGDVPPEWVETADLLHVTGITPLLSAVAADTIDHVIERARAAGVPVSFDVNYRSALATRETATPVLRAIAERSDLVFGGDDELALLYPGLDEAAAVAELHRSGVSHVVVKRGARGARAWIGAAVTDADGFAISPLDTVGAGDAFVAGYLAAWLEGRTTDEALAQANACGALACLVPGDWEAAPSRRDLARFLSSSDDPVRR